jgi:hypothetical protein
MYATRLRLGPSSGGSYDTPAAVLANLIFFQYDSVLYQGQFLDVGIEKLPLTKDVLQ